MKNIIPLHTKETVEKSFITMVNSLEDEGNITELAKLEAEMKKAEMREHMNYVKDAIANILYFHVVGSKPRDFSPIVTILSRV